MKQKIKFNAGLYIEGLRQLRVTGLISVIVMFAITIIRIIGEFPMPNEPAMYSTSSYTGINWMPWLALSFVVITPMLTLQMFHFMNKRNSSDFYHSIPHTRSTVYISFLAAVMTWVLLSIAATVIPSLIGALIFSNVYALVLDTFFIFMLFCISASVLVMGAITIAKGLSGTLLNSIILTGIILFLPRFLITLILTSLNNHPILSGTVGGGFFSDSLNPVTAIVFSLWGFDSGVSVTELVISAAPIIYGFVLGIIYLIIGLFLFIVRKSETASQSATSRKMQAFFRILIATALLIPVVTTIFDTKYYYSKQGIYGFGLCVWVVVVVFIYFLYELITTKKLKNLVKAIPGLGIAAVLNVAIYFGIAAAYNSEISFRPAADEINSVTVLPEKTNDWQTLTHYDYVLKELDGVTLTNPAVIKDVSDTLGKNIDLAGKNLSSFYNTVYHSGTANVYEMPIMISTNGKDKTRNLFTSESVYAGINSSLCASKDFKDAWTNLPAVSKITGIESYFYGFNTEYFDEETSKELYSMFLDEAKNANFDTWFQSFIMGEPAGMDFNIQIIIDGKNESINIPVYECVAPKTIEKAMALYQKQTQENIDEAMEYLDLLDTCDSFYGEADIIVEPFTSITEYSKLSMLGFTITEEVIATDKDVSFNGGWYFESTDIVREFINARSGDTFDADRDAGILNISFYVYEIDSNEPNIDTCGFYLNFPASEETIETLIELQSKYENNITY